MTGPTTPEPKTLVWALPLSLAATKGISVDFYSSGYLDVSVHQVSLCSPMNSVSNTERLGSVGFPIRKSSDQSVSPTPRSLSQVGTSFIAC